jgi:hypothetical protein
MLRETLIEAATEAIAREQKTFNLDDCHERTRWCNSGYYHRNRCEARAALDAIEKLQTK